MSSSPTEVCLTIDTEFSIGGAFKDPRTRRPIGRPHVDCHAEGEDHGLPFLLKTFQKFGIKATFFVETLSRTYFGDQPLRQTIEAILEAGQDVQLHIHPCWWAFRHTDWAERVAVEHPNDSCAGRTSAELETFLAAGLGPFEEWKLPRPIALRTGNLELDRTIYSAMSRQGLRISSSVGLGVYRPREAELHLASGRHTIDGIIEVPVLTFRQLALGPVGRDHVLTITGVGTAETIAILRAARRSGLEQVVVLTHPFEYVKCAPPGEEGVRPNRINKARLVALCRFISEHPDEFTSVSFSAAAPRWLLHPATERPELRAPLLASLSSLIENQANDRLRWL